MEMVNVSLKFVSFSQVIVWFGVLLLEARRSRRNIEMTEIRRHHSEFICRTIALDMSTGMINHRLRYAIALPLCEEIRN